MTTATRLDTDMSHWAPTTRHYAVDGGHLAVTVNTFLTATGTDVFYCDETGAAISLTPLAQFAAGTSHNGALEAMGYTVVDDIVDIEPVIEQASEEPAADPVLDILPPEIAAMIANANQETPQ